MENRQSPLYYPFFAVIALVNCSHIIYLSIILINMWPIIIASAIILLTIVYFMLNKKSSDGFSSYPLIHREDITHNTRLLRFGLNSPQDCLGLPIGQHIELRFFYTDPETNETKALKRPYTPTSSDDDKGHFDLVVKIYAGGRMTQHLEAMHLGDKIDISPPKGRLSYEGHGKFTIASKTDPNVKTTFTVKRVGMIAGGTGITPMLQVIRAVVKDPTDKTELSLIFGNVSEDDILLKPELDSLVKKHKNIRVFYTIDKPTEGWTGGRGFVTGDMIDDKTFKPSDDTLMTFCGPLPMVRGAMKASATLGHAEDRLFDF